MGTHPIFESDFDCLTDSRSNCNEIGQTKMAPISMAVLMRTVAGKLVNIPLASLRRRLVDHNLLNFHEKAIQYQFWYTSTFTSVRLKTIRILDGSKFPSNEGIAKQSAKNAHRVIENKKEIIEFYADSIIQGISFIFTIAVLYFAYVLFEQESKEKEAEAKRLTKQRINRIKDSIGAIQNDMQELQYQNANLEGLLRAAKRDNCTLHNQLFELKHLLKLKTQ